MNIIKKFFDKTRQEHLSPEPFKTSDELQNSHSEELTPRQRLKNVLTTVEKLACSHSNFAEKTIFYIIKIYTDKINRNDNTNLLESSMEYFSKFARDDVLFSSNFKYNPQTTFKIYLGKSPVISDIWQKDRLINSIETIGESDNPFKEKRLNNIYEFYMPLGITRLVNGNHSANSGIIKSQGYLEFDPSCSNCQAYDIAPLYDDYYFDGSFYKSKNTDEIIQQSIFEYGCLFEIGRILKENNINYFNYFK